MSTDTARTIYKVIFWTIILLWFLVLAIYWVIFIREMAYWHRYKRFFEANPSGGYHYYQQDRTYQGSRNHTMHRSTKVEDALTFFGASSWEDAKVAYRKMAKANHPDLYTNSDAKAQAEARMQVINMHYAVLKAHFSQ